MLGVNIHILQAQQAKAKCGAARKRGANHLLCAAARRKREKCHRGRPEIHRISEKCEFWDHLEIDIFACALRNLI